MENQFEELKEKFEKHIGINNSSMELSEINDTELCFEVKSKDVTKEMLTLIMVFLEDNLDSEYNLIGIECIDNYQYLTYRYLK
jgi:hypothetical protein